MRVGPERSEGPYRMASEGLPTYLVHGSHEKLLLFVSIYFLIFFYITTNILSIKLELQAMSSEAISGTFL